MAISLGLFSSSGERDENRGNVLVRGGLTRKSATEPYDDCAMPSNLSGHSCH